jgi:DNA sulfur modification protein DndD
MRLTRVTMKNYRQYLDCEYTFPDGHWDSHIVVGRNARGKSNFLNAINWCLYNEEPHLNDEDQAMPIANGESLRQCSEDECISVEVMVEIKDDDNLFIQFKRSANYFPLVSGIGARERNNILKVYQQNEDNRWIPHENELAKNYVEMHFPKNIREIFFFNGELLKKYFSETTSKRIKDTITVVSKIQLLEIIVFRLSKILEKKTKEASRHNPNLKEIQNELEGLQNELVEVQKEFDTIEQELTDAKKEKNQLDDALQGTKDIEQEEKQISEYKKKIDDLSLKIKDKKNQFNHTATEYIVLQYLQEDMVDLKKLIDDMRSKNQLPPPVSSDLLQQILKSNKCKICNTALDEEKKDFVQKLIKSINTSTEIVNLLMEQSNQLTSNMDAFKKLLKEKDNKLNDIEELVKISKEYQDRIDKLERSIHNTPNSEEIKNKRLRRRVLEDSIERNLRLYGVKESEISSLGDLINAKQQEFERALKRHDIGQTIKLEMEFTENLLTIAQKAKNDLIEETRIEVEKKTNEHFFALNWVADRYSDIVLSQDYALNIRHRTGYNAIGSLSGSEIALLTLSYILALHELSNLASPLIIDTPTYNMEGDNIVNFSKVLTEISKSKQIILLLTPKEYKTELEDVFESKTTTLRYIDSENDVSSLKEYNNA